MTGPEISIAATTAGASGLGTVELVRADVAARLGSPLPEVPGGGPATWALWFGNRRLALTEEPLTDEQARGWAERLLGERAGFRCGRLGGGYWLTGPLRIEEGS